MRSGIYLVGIVSVILMLALAFQLLPPPWEGGVAGWFCAIWYLCTLAAGLGYWYKYDKARDREARQRKLELARLERGIAQKTGVGRRQRSY